MSNEFLSFADPPSGPAEASAHPAWKLAVIDDDQAVHDGTRYALRNFQLRGRGITLFGARSAAEGLRLLRDHPDTAIVLLDVVMETEDAGLRLARAIREELKNDLVRIILRTGQPGQAPEQRIVVDYDINDYKAKTELTAERLFTTLTAGLRSFEQLKRMNDMRAGLEMIVSASAELFDHRRLEALATGVLIQLNALLGVEAGGLLVLRESGDGPHAVLASTGIFAEGGRDAFDLAALFRSATGRDRAVFLDGHTHLYAKTGGGSEILVVLDVPTEITETQVSLLTVFAAKLGGAFDNARLHEQILAANTDLERRVADRTQELGAANERLEAQAAHLKRVNAFKNEILGTVAHDLKNPLAVILGRVEMLNNLLANAPPTLADPVNVQIGHVRTAAQRMNRIVDVSVADAMADAFDISINSRYVDLSAIVASVTELNEGLAGAKGQTLEVLLAPSLPISGDPDRLAEAIDNLVSNAIKYAPVGGTIQVTARRRADDAEVSVADSGPGLKPEDVPRLFGRFQRLSAQPTGGESSTGLGLSIVRKIVDLHRGRVEIAEVGPLGGASFSIALPLRIRT